MMLETMLESIEPIKMKGGRGRPRKRPDKLHAEKGYDCRRCREYLRRKGIKARIVPKAKWGQDKAVRA
jgi:IS5 family transposase